MIDKKHEAFWLAFSKTLGAARLSRALGLYAKSKERLAANYEEFYLVEGAEMPSFRNGGIRLDEIIDAYDTQSLEVKEKEAAELMLQISHAAVFMDELLNLKIEYMVSALENSLGSRNAVALIHESRSILEHVATRAHLEKTIHKLSDGLLGQTSESKILEKLRATKDKIYSLFHGKDQKGKPVNVMDFVRDLENGVFPGALEYYDDLSALMHPNPRSYALFAPGGMNGSIGLGTDTSLKELESLAYRMATVLHLNDEVIWLVAATITLHGWADALKFERKNKLRSIFTEKKFAGDGKSQATAFHLKKNLGHTEAMRQSYLKVQQMGIDPGTRRLEVGDGFVFDVYDLDGTEVWFRFEMDYE